MANIFSGIKYSVLLSLYTSVKIELNCLKLFSGKCFRNIFSGFRCESGVWLGQFSPCSPSGNTLEEISAAGYDMPCILDPLPEASRLVMFYKDKEVVDQVEVPAGEDITVRCSDIGKYRLEGPQRRRCVGGHFDGRETRCVGLNQMYDYKIDQPPTVLFRHKGGPIAQSNTGELLVFPGTTLHMECLFLKRAGTPKWSVRRATRDKYPQVRPSQVTLQSHIG